MATIFHEDLQVGHVGRARTRRLRITQLSLFCCAVEAAHGLDSWSSEVVAPEAVGPEEPLNVLVVAGTVTQANAALVTETYDRLAQPRAVIAFGVCAISGGPYWDSYCVLPGIGDLVPVDVFVPGCPPRPADLVDALSSLADAVSTSELPTQVGA